MTESQEAIAIRPLTLEDAGIVFAFRNDPFIVSLGSSQRNVSWDEHLNWIRETLKQDKRLAFLVTVNNEPAGQVRFDYDIRNPSTCVISVYLIEKFTGKGRGKTVIRMGCQEIFSVKSAIKEIVAYVRQENVRGKEVFKKLNFVDVESLSSKNEAAFALSRESFNKVTS